MKVEDRKAFVEGESNLIASKTIPSCMSIPDAE